MRVSAHLVSVQHAVAKQTKQNDGRPNGSAKLSGYCSQGRGREVSYVNRCGKYTPTSSIDKSVCMLDLYLILQQ